MSDDLADRRFFVLDDDARDELQALLDRPPRDLPGLRALMQRPSVFEESDDHHD